MMTPWTTDRLLDLSAKDFAQLWTNTLGMQTKGLVGADDLLKLLRDSERSPIAGKKVKPTDPVGITMRAVIQSDAGTEAMIAATDAGLPALAGVEPLLIEAIGKSYNTETDATLQAGTLVVARMEALGYEKSAKPKPLPEGSVGKAGYVFQKKAQ
jgi:hypothetical protein